MSFSNYAEAALLNSLFGKSSNYGTLSSAPTIYVALCESAPTDDSTGSTLTEAGYSGYARVSTSASDWNAAAGTSPTTIDNANAITFPQSAGTNSTVTHFALVSASSAGNVIAWGALSANKTIETGDVPQFAAGSLDITLD
jgi:hypothetical protein